MIREKPRKGDVLVDRRRNRFAVESVEGGNGVMASAICRDGKGRVAMIAWEIDGRLCNDLFDIERGGKIL